MWRSDKVRARPLPLGRACFGRLRSQMAKVFLPIPGRDFDPSEVAISWSVLKRLGHAVVFATPDGRPGQPP
jgi:hypothetical protein